MRSFVLAGIVLSVCLIADSAKLPSSWGRCHKSDKNFSECVRKNVQIAISSLNKPTPELGLATFDPLDIPELYIGEGKGPVNVAQHFKNVKLHGLSNVKILKVDIDFDKKILKATSVNPNLRLQADYNMKGRVLLLPIVGDGPCNVTLVNMKINHVMKFETIQRKGKSYMRATDFKTTMNPEKVIFKFDNLFNGQKDLGDNINKVLNENNEEVFKDVKEGYEKSFGLIFLDLTNRVLPKVPQSEIFLD